MVGSEMAIVGAVATHASTPLCGQSVLWHATFGDERLSCASAALPHVV